VIDGLRKNSEQCGYSGGGYGSYDFFSEKLNVTVSLASQVAHDMPSAGGVIQDVARQQPAPSKSTISKYFNKDPACVTHSTQKKRAALKNMNKKSEAQKNDDARLCTSSSAGVEVELNGKNTERSTVCNESEGGTYGKPGRISWVNKLGSEIDSQEVLTFQGEVENPGEHDNGVLSRHRDEDNHLPNDSSENCSAASGLCPENEEYRATICAEDAGSLKNVKNCDNVDTKSTAFTTSESKRCRSGSESDSIGIESIPLRERLSKKNALKKPKTASDNEATGKGKEIDSITDSTEVDSIPLSSRLSTKNALKKPKTASDDEAIDKRKGDDSTTDYTEVDSIPLSFRLSKKNTVKKPKTAFESEDANKRGETDSFPESDSTDVDSVPLHARMLKRNTLKRQETTSTRSDEATGKRKKEDSHTDSTDVDSVPLRVRMSQKNTLKKPETASTRSDEATGKRNGVDSITDSADVDSIPLCALLSKNSTLKKPKTASGDETSGIGERTDAITGATEVDSSPVSSRLSKRNALKKVKTASGDEAACHRKAAADSTAVRIGDDNDFESPKAGRSAAGKRKGSDLSDDQDLLTSVFSTDSETSSTSNREARGGLNSKKRKTRRADAKADVSERKVLKPAKKRITKRQMKSVNRTTAETLEGKG